VRERQSPDMIVFKAAIESAVGEILRIGDTAGVFIEVIIIVAVALDTSDVPGRGP
jgi:hypothetical protein